MKASLRVSTDLLTCAEIVLENPVLALRFGPWDNGWIVAPGALGWFVAIKATR